MVRNIRIEISTKTHSCGNARNCKTIVTNLAKVALLHHPPENAEIALGSVRCVLCHRVVCNGACDQRRAE